MRDDTGHKAKGLDWTGPTGFLFWSLLTMIFVGIASVLFININLPWGAGLPDDARAGYWATAIGSGVALAGSLVAIVLARRAQEVSVSLYELEQRVERREADAQLRGHVIETVSAVRGLGDALVAFVAASAPIRDSLALHMLRVALAGQSFEGPRQPLWRLGHGFRPDPINDEAFLQGCRNLEVAIDRLLDSPAGIAAMESRLAALARQEGRNDLPRGAATNMLLTVRSALANNLRRLPADERLVLAGLFSERIGKGWPLESDPEQSELRGQALAVGFCGTLLARVANPVEGGQEIVSLGALHLWNILLSIPARTDLAGAIAAYHAPIQQDEEAFNHLRSSVDRVLDSISLAANDTDEQVSSLPARRLLESMHILRRRFPGLGLEAAYTDLQPQTAQRLDQVLEMEVQSAMAAHAYSAVTEDRDRTIDALLVLYRAQAVRLPLTGPDERARAMLDLGSDVLQVGMSMGRRAEVEADLLRAMASTAIAASFSVVGDDAGSQVQDDWTSALPPEHAFYAAACGALACCVAGETSDRVADLTTSNLEALYLQFVTPAPGREDGREPGKDHATTQERANAALAVLHLVIERLSPGPLGGLE